MTVARPVSASSASAARVIVVGRGGKRSGGSPQPLTAIGGGSSAPRSSPAMPAASTLGSTRYGLASPPATRYSTRAAFGATESTRSAADLLSSPHDATVGAAAKPTIRRYELMVGHAN